MTVAERIKQIDRQIRTEKYRTVQNSIDRYRTVRKVQNSIEQYRTIEQ